MIIFIFKPVWEAPVGSILIAEHDVDPQSLIHNKCAIALMNITLVISPTLGSNWYTFSSNMVDIKSAKLPALSNTRKI